MAMTTSRRFTRGSNGVGGTPLDLRIFWKIPYGKRQKVSMLGRHLSFLVSQNGIPNQKSKRNRTFSSYGSSTFFYDDASENIRRWGGEPLPLASCLTQRQQNQQLRCYHSFFSSSSLTKEAATAPLDYRMEDRWRAIPPANLVHLSIGSVYAYGMWTPSLGTVLGVVNASSNDWTQSELIPVFSVAAVTLGVTTHFLGKWVEDAGPRKAGVIGSAMWGSGLCLAGIGAEAHMLPLVYAGYGILGGIGWGFMYLTPVTTCMKWFPDRRGLATGLALSAFGLGAAVAPPIIQSLIDFYHVDPEYIGSMSEVVLSTLTDGTQVVSSDSPVGIPDTPVVVASANDAAKLGIIPGVYDLNTGDSGVSKALGTLGITYGSTGVMASRYMMVPHPKWIPEEDLDETDESKPASSEVGMTPEEAGKTVQFPLLWLSVFGNATAGVTMLSCSKLMITEIWAGSMPEFVTASFAAGYVSALGAANAAGRLGWAITSDELGRRNTYMLFAIGLPIVAGSPYVLHYGLGGAGHGYGAMLASLAAFCGGSITAVSFYGGVFSVLPAYIADLWGPKHAGAIHGKLLTAWAASAICGPTALAHFRSTAVDVAIQDLLEKVDEDEFTRVFHCPITEAQPLVEAKTVTINRLMEISPDGTLDPTPFLYDDIFYFCASLIGVSALANLAIRPITVINSAAASDKETPHNGTKEPSEKIDV